MLQTLNLNNEVGKWRKTKFGRIDSRLTLKSFTTGVQNFQTKILNFSAVYYPKIKQDKIIRIVTFKKGIFSIIAC
jgi:hypothetical protein